MTGPPYPPPANPASPFDPWTTVISQYANSPTLDALILSFNAAVDQTENIDNFYDMIWNIQTAEGFGLDVWGRIVGVSRTVQLPLIGTSYFGFNEAGSWQSFTGSVGGIGGTFFSGGILSQSVSLGDTQYRQLILAKAAANISDGSIESINEILLTLFAGRGDAYVIDGLNMTMTYRFLFTLTPIETAIVAQTGILPQPVGVAINIQTGPVVIAVETQPHFIGRFKRTEHRIPGRLRMTDYRADVVVETNPTMPLRSRGAGWIQLPRPRYLYTVGGSATDSSGSASGSFIIPGWKSVKP
jgi:hypothetical protein